MKVVRQPISAALLMAVMIAAVAMACGVPADEPGAAQAGPTTASNADQTVATAVEPPATAPVAESRAPASAAGDSTRAATATPAPIPTAGDSAADAATSGNVVFTLVEGSVARFKVEEELARTGFKVATGVTQDVAGAIAFAADGTVIADESRMVVMAATLTTDSNRRDGYVRQRTLETDQYPDVVFVPTSVAGLPESLAGASGTAEYTITGDLTIKDQTREVTWDATAKFDGAGNVSGMASVEFTFEYFDMDKPSVAVVLSVDDTIRLELDYVGTITEE